MKRVPYDCKSGLNASSNLVRFTATIRARGDSQLIVRASAQFYLQPVEEPGPYQQFFRALEQALFLQGQPAE